MFMGRRLVPSPAQESGLGAMRTVEKFGGKARLTICQEGSRYPFRFKPVGSLCMLAEGRWP